MSSATILYNVLWVNSFRYVAQHVVDKVTGMCTEMVNMNMKDVHGAMVMEDACKENFKSKICIEICWEQHCSIFQNMSMKLTKNQ